MSDSKHTPGTTVVDSGIIKEIGPRGGVVQGGRHATVVADEPFPPTSKSGNKWAYEEKTPKKK